MKTIDDFLNQIENDNTRSNYRFLPDLLNIIDLGASVDELASNLKEFLISLWQKGKCSGKNSFKTYKSRIHNYAQYIGNENFLIALSKLDCDELNKLYPPQKPPFISFSQFRKLLLDINNHDEINVIPTITLLTAIYEGIYSGNGKVLLNLRANDINIDNCVAILNDGNRIYDFHISKQLANNFLYLGEKSERENRKKCIYPAAAYGLNPDSCFKVLPRSDGSSIEKSVLDYLWRTVRKSTQKYLGYQIMSKNLFISGLMYRISKQFKKKDDFIKYFESPDRQKNEAKIITENELKRCNSKLTIGNLRNLVKGYTHLFVEEEPTRLSRKTEYPEKNANKIYNVEYFDIPQKKSEPKIIKKQKVYPRNRNVCELALIYAENKCEIDPTHPSFLRKSNGKNYTETHHLIPMSYQDDFDVGIDVLANVVSLCSNCHNQIHYGQGNEKLIENLFWQRKERLKETGINIELEELLKMY